MNTVSDDPRELIFSFLTELPTTIRTEIWMWVVIYAARTGDPSKSDEFESIVRDYLMAPGIEGVGAAICTAAVIDHAIYGMVEKFGRAEAAFKMIADRHPSAATQKLLLGLPLRQRHLQQASATWKELRAQKLSPRKLQDFEDSQLKPPPAQ
jgi:hypothetical protein